MLGEESQREVRELAIVSLSVYHNAAVFIVSAVRTDDESLSYLVVIQIFGGINRLINCIDRLTHGIN